MALAGIPFAIGGGIVALYLLIWLLAFPSAVGFVSLFGVSVMNGILIDLDEGGRQFFLRSTSLVLPSGACNIACIEVDRPHAIKQKARAWLVLSTWSYRRGSSFSATPPGSKPLRVDFCEPNFCVALK
jgi:hypothetical protein